MGGKKIKKEKEDTTEEKKKRNNSINGKKERKAWKNCEKGDPAKEEKNLWNNKGKARKNNEFRKPDASDSKRGGSIAKK